MPEQQEPSREIEAGRDYRETSVSDSASYAERDLIKANVVNVFHIIPDGASRQKILKFLSNPMTPVSSIREELEKLIEGSHLTVDDAERKSIQKIIESSEFESITNQIKSYQFLAQYLGDKEHREWLAEFMAYGCRQQLIDIGALKNLHENREIFVKWLCYCLKWVQAYCSMLKPGLINDTYRDKLKKYPPEIFNQAFAVLEFYITVNSINTNQPELTSNSGELSILKQSVKLLKKAIYGDFTN